MLDNRVEEIGEKPQIPGLLEKLVGSWDGRVRHLIGVPRSNNNVFMKILVPRTY